MGLGEFKISLIISKVNNIVVSNSERTRAVLLCGTHGDGGVTGLTSREALDRKMYETECQCEELSSLTLET